MFPALVAFPSIARRSQDDRRRMMWHILLTRATLNNVSTDLCIFSTLSPIVHTRVAHTFNRGDIHVGQYAGRSGVVTFNSRIPYTSFPTWRSSPSVDGCQASLPVDFLRNVTKFRSMHKLAG
jgi:hypothetical protein